MGPSLWTPLLFALEVPEALGDYTAAARVSPHKRAAWADLKDDLDDGFSECSTQAPGDRVGRQKWLCE